MRRASSTTRTAPRISSTAAVTAAATGRSTAKVTIPATVRSSARLAMMLLTGSGLVLTPIRTRS